MAPARHLVIFLKAPRLGRVKSRLARGIGAVAAARFYRHAADALLRRLAHDPRWRCHLAIAPDHHVDLPRAWSRIPGRRGQGSGDLGRRMGQVLGALPPGPVVIIGSDIPAITARHVAVAFAALGAREAVFGPAADGGYWLIGLRRRPRLPPGLFAGVRWSSEHALADTLASLPPRTSTAMLELLEDVDEVDAYRRWRASLSPRPA